MRGRENSFDDRRCMAFAEERRRMIISPLTLRQANDYVEPTIFHGTPLTPRAALQALLPGRAACVSFWRRP